MKVYSEKFMLKFANFQLDIKIMKDEGMNLI